MRYLTNQLGWNHNALATNYWVCHQGNALESQFSFGANHDWQAPLGQTRVFATEPLTIEMARTWIARDEFTSLVCGHESWAQFLQDCLRTTVCMFNPDNEQKKFQLELGDVVLRVGYACANKLPEPWSKRFIEDLPDHELLALLTEQPELIRFYLHFPMKQSRSQSRSLIYDAGL